MPTLIVKDNWKKTFFLLPRIIDKRLVWFKYGYKRLIWSPYVYNVYKYEYKTEKQFIADILKGI